MKLLSSFFFCLCVLCVSAFSFSFLSWPSPPPPPHSPRWSPDGKLLALLSAREEDKTQVWLLSRQGGEAQQLTDTVQDVEDVYPDEYHEFNLPSHIEDRLQRNLAWYAHFVKADGTPIHP